MTDISHWSNISKSLLLPLYFRAVETDNEKPIVYDEKAKEIINNVNYDFYNIDGFNIMQTATVMRESVFDDLVHSFLEKNPKAVIVNIGSGLDTRFFRMDNGQVLWYELDLPEVIDARKDLFEETDRYKFIKSCAFDTSWLKKIDHGSRPVLFLAEGFLIYFPREIVRKLLVGIKQEFPGSSFAFDVVSPFQAMLSGFNPALNLMDVWFKWGMNCAQELNCWDSDIETKDVIYYFRPSFDRLGWYSWYSMMPVIRYGFYIISCILGTNKAGEDYVK